MWWEKTIEYLFVVTFLDRNVLMAPLDGNYEAGGDLIANHDDRWVLIEFKRNADAVADEVQKFAEPSEDSFDKANAQLGDSDGHHLLIFGEKGENEPVKLKAISYFRRQVIEPMDILGCGVTRERFNSYLSEFLRLKFGDTEEGAGGRSLNYSTVIAVNSNGEVTHCEGLTSFCDRMGLGPDLSPDPPPNVSSTLGMGGPG